jgi:hypothetical protein
MLPLRWQGIDLTVSDAPLVRVVEDNKVFQCLIED